MKNIANQPESLFDPNSSQSNREPDFIVDAEFTEGANATPQSGPNPSQSSPEPVESFGHADSNPFVANPQPELGNSHSDSHSFWPKEKPSLPQMEPAHTRRPGTVPYESWLRWGLGILIVIAIGFSLHHYFPKRNQSEAVVSEKPPVVEIRKEKDPLQPDPSKSKAQRVQEAVEAIRKAIKN
jgi:hypothetical protein